MPEVLQNTLYLMTPGTYVHRDHLTLRIKVPIAPDPPATEEKSIPTEYKSLSIPIHHLESVCLFGPGTITPPALALCWERDVSVNFLSENGRFQARMTGVADTSVRLRRDQFRAADQPGTCVAIARQFIVGKIHNARNSLLRAAREAGDGPDRDALLAVVTQLAQSIRQLPGANSPDTLRGLEGLAGQAYFSVFDRMLKRQREAFRFIRRSRRPPRDAINCLLSFLYALVRHDCIAALTATGLDPFVGFLHSERPNRPALALDLMEEFRPWLADRLAVTLVNRQQIAPKDFNHREGGAVELTDAGRRCVVQAYQERKREKLNHPALKQNLHTAQLPFVQSRLLARRLRGDFNDYLPFVPK